jgi:hypothetical protein
MRTFTKYAAALTLTGALAVAAATPSQARHGWNAAAGGFVAGAVIGAAAANANNGYYGSGYYDPGYAYDYDYAPGYAYAPAYGYTPRNYGSGYSDEGNCTVSPGSGNYTPCYTNR